MVQTQCFNKIFFLLIFDDNKTYESLEGFYSERNIFFCKIPQALLRYTSIAERIYVLKENIMTTVTNLTKKINGRIEMDGHLDGTDKLRWRTTNLSGTYGKSVARRDSLTFNPFIDLDSQDQFRINIRSSKLELMKFDRNICKWSGVTDWSLGYVTLTYQLLLHWRFTGLVSGEFLGFISFLQKQEKCICFIFQFEQEN